MNKDENVRIVTEFLGSQKRDISEAMSLLADDIIWCSQRPRYSFSGSRVADVLSMGPLRGIDEVRDFFTALSEEIEIEDGKITDIIADGDKVVALTQSKFWVKATGKGSETSSALVFTVRDGKIIEVRAYDDTAAVQDALTPAP